MIHLKGECSEREIRVSVYEEAPCFRLDPRVNAHHTDSRTRFVGATSIKCWFSTTPLPWSAARRIHVAAIASSCLAPWLYGHSEKTLNQH
jgi:hypothetical protein